MSEVRRAAPKAYDGGRRAVLFVAPLPAVVQAAVAQVRR